MVKTIEHKQQPEVPEYKAVNAISGLTKIIILITLILSLIAVGISYLLYQQVRHNQTELSQLNDPLSGKITGKISSISDRLNLLTNEQKAFQAQLMTEQENFQSRARQQRTETEAMSRKLEISNQQLLQSMQVLFKHKGREHISWVLAEAEYLLLIANHSLQLQADIKTAVTALQLADERLLDTGDPGVIEIRSQIHEEIEQLKAVQHKDLVPLVGKLTASINRVNQLPVNFTQFEAGEKAEKITEKPLSNDVGNLQRAGQELLKELQSLVILRQTNKPAQPMITPKEQFFLQQNLQLKLEMARYALLADKPQLYAESLQAAIDWLETYFDQHASEVSLMTEGLRSLLETDITPIVLPHISHSISLLRAYEKELSNSPQPVAEKNVLQDEVK